MYKSVNKNTYESNAIGEGEEGRESSYEGKTVVK